MTKPIIETLRLNLFYGNFQALIDVNLSVEGQKITALIGPSGCGKSTLVRVFNRMNDLIDDVRVEGRVLVQGENIYAQETNLIALRKKVGMVFQRPNPFPLSVRENVTFGLEIHQEYQKEDHSDILEQSLRDVLLWNDLKDKLDQSALKLSLEQQQRLCIARVLAMKSQIILMDEPCSALDPIATLRIEELMQELKKNYTIVIVTHNMKQAARASDMTAFLYLGELVEYAETNRIFSAPREKRTEEYITGRFG
ncbi:MAG TPA: phosphate ABC transporter ATP-binding protein PstB [Candidatus Hodarchaeales archaeon]|nr:phosphate ABC transporter ATP-binding protein PstB [Candidatus Hodarchaeales archaeon]